MFDNPASSELFSQAAILLFVGMTFVFLFLILLICGIKFIIVPLGKKFPDDNVDDKSQTNHKHPPDQVVAVISAAIKKYRDKHSS